MERVFVGGGGGEHYEISFTTEHFGKAKSVKISNNV